MTALGSAGTRITYPVARRDVSIVDNHFGELIPDPYRWLEDPDGEETKFFVDAQNALSKPFYQTAVRDRFFVELKKIYNYPKYGVPFREGDRWFYWYNTGLQNQHVLYTKKNVHDQDAEVFLDPNEWSEDGTSAVGSIAFTEDGSLLAYTRSEKGSDWRKIYFMRVEDRHVFADVLKHVKFSSLTWSPDNRGVFYNRYDVSDDREADGRSNTQHEFQKVYYHELGTDQKDDILILSFPENPKWLASVEISWDQRYLVCNVSESCSPTNRVWVADLMEVKGKGLQGPYDLGGLRWQKIVDNFDAGYDYVTNNGEEFFFLTNKDAPRYKIVKVDLRQPEELSWTVVVEEKRDLLERAVVVHGNTILLHYMRDVVSALEVRDLETAKIRGEIPLELGTVSTVSGRRKYSHLFFSFTSFTTPSIIYEADLSNETSQPDAWTPKVYRETKLEGADLSQLEVKQHFYKGKDGTRIPMFIMHKKDLVLTGDNPTLLYGYGGFNIPITPSFSAARVVAMLHLGLVLAIANIRGGGEYGRDWYEAAIKGKKQVSYDDFQQAAEYLIENRYTSPKHLAIQGASNGGLLVAVCANQRPDLYGAVVAQVGVLDLLRFHKFTIGYAWTSDYGNPDNEEDFRAIRKISPLHNIGNPSVPVAQGHQYPAVFLMTTDHDDRVSPFHSLKFIAELQYAVGQDPSQKNPLLIRVDTDAGHGAGKPTDKILHEAADMYGFLANVFSLEWHDA